MVPTRADLIPDDPALTPGLRGLIQGGAFDFGAGAHELTYSLNRLSFAGGAWNATRIDAIARAFDAFEAVADLEFELQAGSGINRDPYFSPADIAVTLTGSYLGFNYGAVGLAVYPDRAAPGTPANRSGDQFLADLGLPRSLYPNPEGDIFLDDAFSGFNQLQPGGYGLGLMLHELGHALGLKHPHDGGLNGRPTYESLGIGDASDPDLDDGLWTVMSYDDPQNPLVSLSFGYQATLMPFDILALQHIYGPNLSYRTGDNVYRISADGVVKTIWDAGGEDTLNLSALRSGVTLSLEPGTGFSHGRGSYTALAFAVEDDGQVVNLIENVVGTAFRDDITGNDAGNTLNGGGGADTLTGGLGDDVYVVDSGGDVIFEFDGEGEDSVVALVSYSLDGSALENLELRGRGSMEGNGSALDNLLVANAGATVLRGLEGDDVLRFAPGTFTAADWADGGPGDDTLELGGVVPDAALANISNIEHLVLLPGGLPTLRLGPVSEALGLDRWDLSLQPAGSRTLIDAAARSLGVTVDGGAADDTFIGGAGDDVVDGGAGSDLFMLDPATAGTDALDGGEGDDAVAFLNVAAVADALFAGLAGIEAVLLGGPSPARELTLGALSEAAGISLADAGALRGRNGSATLDATDRTLAVTLRGGSAADQLIGGAGADRLIGGAGNDTYLAGSADDIVEAGSRGGRDTLLTDDPAAELALNVEILQLLGSGDLNATGNRLNNDLIGNAGANTLDGNGGRDRLYGGAGDDTYLVDGGDRVFEDADAGHDTVLSSASFTLPNGVESLVLTGGGNINGNGSNGNDTLAGNSGANVLNGRNGNDRLDGGDGADRLLGGSGNDTLDGGAGRDRLDGGAGDDRFVFDALDALVSGGRGFDTVIVQDAGLTITLPATLRSIEHIDLGGSGDNTLVVSFAGIRTLAPEGRRLVVDGDAGDGVQFRAEGWTPAGIESIDGTDYELFALRGYQVLVHPDVDTLLL